MASKRMKAPEKFATLIGMTATYRGDPQWTGMIHEVQGNYALVQYEDQSWQLVGLDKVNACTLELSEQKDANKDNTVGRGQSRFKDMRPGRGPSEAGDPAWPAPGGPKR